MLCLSPLYLAEKFPIWKGTQLASRYEVQAFLGEGNFGKVARCVDIVSKTKVAIKITKDEPQLTMQALEEVKHQYLTSSYIHHIGYLKLSQFVLKMTKP